MSVQVRRSGRFGTERYGGLVWLRCCRGGVGHGIGRSVVVGELW